MQDDSDIFSEWCNKAFVLFFDLTLSKYSMFVWNPANDLILISALEEASTASQKIANYHKIFF